MIRARPKPTGSSFRFGQWRRRVAAVTVRFEWQR
jgi:hypothetical protein